MDRTFTLLDSVLQYIIRKHYDDGLHIQRQSAQHSSLASLRSKIPGST